MWGAIQPRCEALNIDRRRCREMLQASFCQAPIATLTQPKSSDPLGERPCNPCPFIVPGFPSRGGLLLPGCLEGVMRALRPDREMPCSGFRLGTPGALYTLATVLRSKLDTDHRIVPGVQVGNPRRAGFPLWTGRTLSLPIDSEVTNVVGLRLLRLPRDIRAHRAK